MNLVEEKDEVQKMIERTQAIKDRVAKMQLFHEDLVILERIDTSSVSTFLVTDPRASRQRVRESWYGRIIAISPRDSGDPVKEKKKAELKVDDIVSYNPESAYSLNVSGFDEIWCMSVENNLVIDRGFDPVQAKTLALEAKKQAELANEMEMQKGAKIFMDQLKRAEAMGVAHKPANVAPAGIVMPD